MNKSENYEMLHFRITFMKVDAQGHDAAALWRRMERISHALLAQLVPHVESGLGRVGLSAVHRERASNPALIRAASSCDRPALACVHAAAARV